MPDRRNPSGPPLPGGGQGRKPPPIPKGPIRAKRRKIDEEAKTRVVKPPPSPARIDEDQMTVRRAAPKPGPRHDPLADGPRYRTTGLRWAHPLGQVFNAVDNETGDRVVTTLVHAKGITEGHLAAGRATANVLAGIVKPYINGIVDIVRYPDDRLAIVTEYINASVLSEQVGKKALPPARVIGILRQVCRALGDAHRAGVAHGALSVASVLLTGVHGRPDSVVVTDFGLQGIVDAQLEIPSIGAAYQPVTPERVLGLRRTEKEDLYLVGCLGYVMLTGGPPFRTGSAQAVQRRHAIEDPMPIEERLRSTRLPPTSLTAVIHRCLAKEQEERFGDMADLEAELCLAQIDAGIVTPWDDLPLPQVDDDRKQRILTGLQRAGRGKVPEIGAPVVVDTAASRPIALGDLESLGLPPTKRSGVTTSRGGVPQPPKVRRVSRVEPPALPEAFPVGAAVTDESGPVGVGDDEPTDRNEPLEPETVVARAPRPAAPKPIPPPPVVRTPISPPILSPPVVGRASAQKPALPRVTPKIAPAPKPSSTFAAPPVPTTTPRADSTSGAAAPSRTAAPLPTPEAVATDPGVAAPSPDEGVASASSVEATADAAPSPTGATHLPFTTSSSSDRATDIAATETDIASTSSDRATDIASRASVEADDDASTSVGRASDSGSIPSERGHEIASPASAEEGDAAADVAAADTEGVAADAQVASAAGEVASVDVVAASDEGDAAASSDVASDPIEATAAPGDPADAEEDEDEEWPLWPSEAAASPEVAAPPAFAPATEASSPWPSAPDPWAASSIDGFDDADIALPRRPWGVYAAVAAATVLGGFFLVRLVRDDEPRPPAKATVAQPATEAATPPVEHAAPEPEPEPAAPEPATPEPEAQPASPEPVKTEPKKRARGRRQAPSTETPTTEQPADAEEPARTSGSGNAAQLFAEGNRALNAGNYDKATTYLSEAVDKSPRNARYRLSLGDALFKQGKYQFARIHYVKARELGHASAANRIDAVDAKLGGP